MNDALKAKHVLGGLTLGDLRDLFNTPVVILDDWVKFMFPRITGDVLELSNEHGNLRIRLSIPVKVEDGKIILSPDNEVGYTVMTLGRMEFVQKRVEIPIS